MPDPNSNQTSPNIAHDQSASFPAGQPGVVSPVKPKPEDPLAGPGPLDLTGDPDLASVIIESSPAPDAANVAVGVVPATPAPPAAPVRIGVSPRSPESTAELPIETGQTATVLEEEEPTANQAQEPAPSGPPPVFSESEATVKPPSGEIAGMHSGETAGGLIKKFGTILLVLALLGAIGFGVFRFVIPRFFGRPGGTSGKEITLTYWGLWEPEAIMSQVIADWEAANPEVKINYVLQSPQEYRERLQSALARGEGPDLFRFHITWVPMFKQELAVMPDSVMTAPEYEAAFYPAAVKNLQSGTGYLGIPLMMDNLALFYNQNMFEAAGKTPPVTWDELRQTANGLTVKDQDGRIVVAGIPLGMTGNIDHWSDILGLMMLQNGADLANPAACSEQAGREVCLGVDALTFFTLFAQADRIWDETMPDSTLAFASGKAAMYLGPSWRIFNIKEINPQLNFGVAPVPQLSVNSQINWASFWVEGVAEKSQLKKQAWEFLKFLSSQETMEKLYQSASQSRLFGEIYSRRESGATLAQNPLLKPFVDQAVSAQTWYLCSRTFDNGLNDRMIKYYEDAVNAVHQGKPAKEVLETATNGVNQLLSQYGLATAAPR